MSKLAEAGDIKLPKIDSQFLNYIVFFENFGFSDELQLNDFPGGLTLFYTNHIVLLNFDSTIKSQKEFEKTISSVYQLSKDYVIVIFKNENFFEIYNLDNFNLVEVVKFQSKILLSATSVNQTKIIDLSNLKCVYLMISFDTNETEIFNICIKDDRIELNKELNVPSCGLKINSLKIIPENKSMSMISYENLSFTLCQMENKQISYINWKENKHISLKMLDASSSSILLLGSNGILYIVTFESFKCFEINGKFTNGCFMSDDKIIAVEGGALSIFKFKIELDKHRYVKMGTIDAHYEDITFFFVKDEMVLTTSKDGTVKVFVSVQLEEKSELRFNFHKAVDEIKELINIDEENLISTMKNSNQLHIWNKPSGKIVYNLLLNTDEIILNVFYAGSKLVVASQIDKDKLLLRLYSIKNQKSKFELEENSRKEISIVEKIKFLSDIHKKELFILFQQKNAILVHNLTEKTFNNPSKLEQNSTIDLSSISLNDGQFKIKNSCLVQQSQLIAIFHHPTLYLISPKNGSTIASKQISDLKTNSDKNFNHNLISIENTDAFIMLDNIGNLVYVNFNVKSNDIEYFPSNNYKFESFKINKRFLLAYTKIESKILCFDLDSVLNEKSFKNNYFTLDINSDKLLHYGLSLENNYLFLVKNRKDLCFYRINGNNSDKIGKDSELMLHAEATSILCTNDFISISTMDRKVVSYLICDKDNLQVTLDKIQKLPRKSELDDETKRKNDLITNQYLDLNESGDEEIDYFKDEALEEENSKISKKIKDARKNVSNQVLFQHKIEQAQLKNNWALNLVNKESEANVKETLSFSKPKVVISNNHSSQACLIS
ncbi:unnamed protein product [Brachionus calyciflorus]|uniref:Uncharacterized protein n=1 Tax=Brachionus calyciflorus TaxID=104777 RepID=A0A813SX81_9BILA|nr:unnamed protein product [Brachionus calyciflorus]